MKTGINLMLFGASPASWPKDLIPRLHGAGAEWIEVPVFEPRPAVFKEIARQIRDLGLGVSVSSALPPQASAVSDQTSADHWQEFLARLACTSETLGAELIVGPLYHPVGGFAAGSQSDLQQRLAQRLSKWKPEAAVRLAIEPLNRFETNVLNLCVDGARVVDAAANPAVGLMADTFHMHIEERDPAAALRGLGPRCIHLHASENDRGPIGGGQVDWEPWLPAARTTGAASVVAECFAGGLAELSAATRIWRDITGDPTDCAARSLQFLCDLLSRRSLHH
ncbi:MAG: sugar phosphate isomerase/epimerase [Opitutus sp.]|nr:sugar phosphate isomerase/epimerase [Opitutus sp.]MCS6248616.1 sugar phosphate isomerase/epimerase [Opitutus sp.]MCS6275381.1 sugar phosphate isomerase/epimerase [Opitutus sp.]MCS6276108.1 sugar phosphate isomerase/epimerase [Opitutus sp.]MCS6301202.1 sugar phosphate isomerase/epimerase [Opitutus sp.]